VIIQEVSARRLLFLCVKGKKEEKWGKKEEKRKRKKKKNDQLRPFKLYFIIMLAF